MVFKNSLSLDNSLLKKDYLAGKESELNGTKAGEDYSWVSNDAPITWILGIWRGPMEKYVGDRWGTVLIHLLSNLVTRVLFTNHGVWGECINCFLFLSKRFRKLSSALKIFTVHCWVEENL